MAERLDAPLRGRTQERAALERLLDAARAGRSQVLVLRGEAGTGKTALLRHLEAHATGCRVVRTVGVESEMELAYAALHQVCVPFLGSLDRLPPPQRQALGTAFGLTAGPPPDRFLVGLAVLTLLTDAADEQPVVCLVDDAQWLDQASARTLAFVARRLLADPLAVVFAVRDGADELLHGLPTMPVLGLAAEDARALLDSVLTGPVDERVRARILGEARGNALALLEAPHDLTPLQLAGGFGLAEAAGTTDRLERGFSRRLRVLPAQTRLLLLTAALEPIGDVGLLWRAASRLGLEAAAAAPAVHAGLLELGSSVQFRHPVVRSAARRSASAAEVRSAHEALAQATDARADPDRRAWHRASAAVAPDASVADELERSAGRAAERGGVAAAAAFLRRSAELTPEPVVRGVRAVNAAQAVFEAAAPDSATALLALAASCPLDALQQARVDRLRARLTFFRRQRDTAPAQLHAAAVRLQPLDLVLARETHLEALGASIFAGRLGPTDQQSAVVHGARSAPPPSGGPGPADLLLDGLALSMTDGYVSGLPALRRALHAFAGTDAGEGFDEVTLRWLWLAWPVAYEVWDDETWHRMTTRLVALARRTGALTLLPIALVFRAQLHTQAGEFGAVVVLHEELRALRAATGDAPLMYSSTAASGPMVLAAWRGQEARARALISSVLASATAAGEGRAIAVAHNAMAVLCNGLGDYAAARTAAAQACEYADLGLYAWSCAELVEAAVRSGDVAAAEHALSELRVRTSAAATDWALGMEARCTALLSTGADAEALHRRSVERLSRTRIHVARARAHLLYGEWLRREGRRTEAREQLRAGHALFVQFGMDAFAGRAQRELLGTGETARRRVDATRDHLTAQERQIAELAAERLTNPEIAARLFLSARTVEWHLSRIFTKLGVTSRRELAPALSDGAATSTTS